MFTIILNFSSGISFANQQPHALRGLIISNEHTLRECSYAKQRTHSACSYANKKRPRTPYGILSLANS